MISNLTLSVNRSQTLFFVIFHTVSRNFRVVSFLSNCLNTNSHRLIIAKSENARKWLFLYENEIFFTWNWLDIRTIRTIRTIRIFDRKVFYIRSPTIPIRIGNPIFHPQRGDIPYNSSPKFQNFPEIFQKYFF